MTGTLNSSGATGLTVAADAVALGTDTTGNYVAGPTANAGLALTGTEAGTLGISLQANKGLEVDTNGLIVLRYTLASKDNFSPMAIPEDSV